MRDSHIKSMSLAFKGYLPSQLQEILTLVRKYECSDSYYVCPSNVSIASRATCCDKHAENLYIRNNDFDKLQLNYCSHVINMNR